MWGKQGGSPATRQLPSKNTLKTTTFVTTNNALSLRAGMVKSTITYHLPPPPNTYLYTTLPPATSDHLPPTTNTNTYHHPPLPPYHYLLPPTTTCPHTNTYTYLHLPPPTSTYPPPASHHLRPSRLPEPTPYSPHQPPPTDAFNAFLVPTTAPRDTVALHRPRPCPRQGSDPQEKLQHQCLRHHRRQRRRPRRP